MQWGMPRVADLTSWGVRRPEGEENKRQPIATEKLNLGYLRMSRVNDCMPETPLSGGTQDYSLTSFYFGNKKATMNNFKINAE